MHIKLNSEIERKLNRLSQIMGRSKSDLVREALFDLFKKYADILLAEDFKEELNKFFIKQNRERLM